MVFIMKYTHHKISGETTDIDVWAPFCPSVTDLNFFFSVAHKWFERRFETRLGRVNWKIDLAMHLQPTTSFSWSDSDSDTENVWLFFPKQKSHEHRAMIKSCILPELEMIVCICTEDCFRSFFGSSIVSVQTKMSIDCMVIHRMASMMMENRSPRYFAGPMKGRIGWLFSLSSNVVSDTFTFRHGVQWKSSSLVKLTLNYPSDWTFSFLYT
jgi:hypothetical protein